MKNRHTQKRRWIFSIEKLNLHFWIEFRNQDYIRFKVDSRIIINPLNGNQNENNHYNRTLKVKKSLILQPSNASRKIRLYIILGWKANEENLSADGLAAEMENAARFHRRIEFVGNRIYHRGSQSTIEGEQASGVIGLTVGNYNHLK